MTTKAASKSTKAPYVPAAVRPRSVNIEPYGLPMAVGDTTPTYWFYDNPVLSNFMTAFTAVFPAGERYMVEVVKQFRDQVRADTRLHKEVSGFIGQEALHAQKHEVLNKLLEARGVPMAAVEDVVGLALWAFRKMPKRHQMAYVGAAEHLTALFGELVLKNPEIVENLHPDLRPLWVWHSIEETEHKAVTYDLYQAVDGSYLRRVYGYLLLLAIIVTATTYATARLCWADRSIFNLRADAKSLWWMFGFGKNAGYFRHMVPSLLQFFAPGFHPWNHDNSHLVDIWKPKLQEMLAAQAGLDAAVH